MGKLVQGGLTLPSLADASLRMVSHPLVVRAEAGNPAEIGSERLQAIEEDEATATSPHQAQAPSPAPAAQVRHRPSPSQDTLPLPPKPVSKRLTSRRPS